MLEPRPRPALLVGLALALPTLGGCVLPGNPTSGLEISWLVGEDNLVDGKDARQLRSCDGARMTHVEVSLVDLGDPDRSGTFLQFCEDSYQTPEQFASRVPDLFFQLEAGNYEVTLRGQALAPDRPAATLVSLLQEVEVGDRTATQSYWELRPATGSLELELQNPGACDELTLSLLYDDAETDLVGVADDGGDLLYRVELASTDGTANLGGRTNACAALDDGALPRFADLDRGDYRLRIDVDGTVCERSIAIDGGETPVRVTLDLAGPPC